MSRADRRNVVGCARSINLIYLNAKDTQLWFSRPSETILAPPSKDSLSPSFPIKRSGKKAHPPREPRDRVELGSDVAGRIAIGTTGAASAVAGGIAIGSAKALLLASAPFSLVVAAGVIGTGALAVGMARVADALAPRQ